jgi:hypothetical protein
VLDHIDGGLTVLLRCPGFKIEGARKAEKITVDTYVSPCKLKEGRKEMSKQVALLIQVFGAELAVDHLDHFQAHCVLEGIQLPSAPGMLKQAHFYL